MKRNDIGESIRIARQAQCLTQRQLAKIANLPKSSISRWETGECLPNIQSCWQIADALNTTLDDLVGRY